VAGSNAGAGCHRCLRRRPDRLKTTDRRLESTETAPKSQPKSQPKDQPQPDAGQQNQTGDNHKQRDQGQPSEDKASEHEQQAPGQKEQRHAAESKSGEQRQPERAPENQSQAPRPPEQTAASKTAGDLQLRNNLISLFFSLQFKLFIVNLLQGCRQYIFMALFI